MSLFVLDASVALAWCFEDEGDAYSDKVLHTLRTSKALVPSLWFLEIANVLLGGERKKRITPADSLYFTSLLKGLPIQVAEAPHSFDDILNVGRSYTLSSYDASYLHLAMKEGLPLATRDAALIKATKAAGVSLYACPISE